MTKKHFQMFAAEIKDALEAETVTREEAAVAARVVANVARRVNAHFNEARFFSACGLSNVEEL